MKPTHMDSSGCKWQKPNSELASGAKGVHWLHIWEDQGQAGTRDVPGFRSSHSDGGTGGWLPLSLVSSSTLAPFSDGLSSPIGRIATGSTMLCLFSNFSQLQNRCLWHGINLPWSVIFPEPVTFKGMWCTDQKDMIICHPKRHLGKLHLRPWGLRMEQGFPQRSIGSYNQKKSKWTGNSVQFLP